MVEPAFLRRVGPRLRGLARVALAAVPVAVVLALPVEGENSDDGSSPAAPADTDLFGENSYIDHKPDCPARGAYSLNAIREKCTCNVSVHAN